VPCGDVALPAPVDVGSWTTGDEFGKKVHRYMGPETRSASARTSSY
jgi:hypothetical protein